MDRLVKSETNTVTCGEDREINFFLQQSKSCFIVNTLSDAVRKLLAESDPLEPTKSPRTNNFGDIVTALKVDRSDSLITFPTANVEKKSVSYLPTPLWDKITDLSKKVGDAQKHCYNPRPLPYSLEADHPLALCLTAPRLSPTSSDFDLQSIPFLAAISQEDIREEWSTRSMLHTAILTERGTATINDLVYSFLKINVLRDIPDVDGIIAKKEINNIRGFCSAVTNPQEELIMNLATELQRKRVKIRERVTSNLRNKLARSALIAGDIFTKGLFDPKQVTLAKELLNSNQALITSVISRDRRTPSAPYQQRRQTQTGYRQAAAQPSTSGYSSNSRNQNPKSNYQAGPSNRPNHRPEPKPKGSGSGPNSFAKPNSSKFNSGSKFRKNSGKHK
jgi:hypothetical protein